MAQHDQNPDNGGYDLLALAIVVGAGVILLMTGTPAQDLATGALAISSLYARWQNKRGAGRPDDTPDQGRHPD